MDAPFSTQLPQTAHQTHVCIADGFIEVGQYDPVRQEWRVRWDEIGTDWSATKRIPLHMLRILSSWAANTPDFIERHRAEIADAAKHHKTYEDEARRQRMQSGEMQTRMADFHNSKTALDKVYRDSGLPEVARQIGAQQAQGLCGSGGTPHPLGASGNGGSLYQGNGYGGACGVIGGQFVGNTADAMAAARNLAGGRPVAQVMDDMKDEALSITRKVFKQVSDDQYERMITDTNEQKTSGTNPIPRPAEAIAPDLLGKKLREW